MTRRSWLLAASVLLLPAAVHAQSLRVIGSNADAIACYRAADSEARRPDAVRTCSIALQQDDLDRDDVLATYVNRGIVRFRLEDFSGATADFDQALALEPGQPDALINKGITLLAAGAPVDSALGLIDQGLASRPQRPWVGYYGRAVAHELAGRDGQAYLAYRRAQELRPGWAPAEHALTRFAVRG